jgi:hypothetical protein
MKAAYASDLDELKNWVEGVRNLPSFLRTPAARALFTSLEGVGVSCAADLDGKDVDALAQKIGTNKDALMASLRVCPFGVPGFS